MIILFIMHRMGWTDIWYGHPGKFGIVAYQRNFHALWPGRVVAGVWTGPERDLVCIKPCATNEEAERYLSPAAPTPLLACLASLWKAWRLHIQAPEMLIVNVTEPSR